jgi:hypothetical protein
MSATKMRFVSKQNQVPLPLLLLGLAAIYDRLSFAKGRRDLSIVGLLRPAVRERAIRPKAVEHWALAALACFTLRVAFAAPPLNFW